MVYSVTRYGKTDINARIFKGITSFTCCWDTSSRARAQMVSLRCAMSMFVGL